MTPPISRPAVVLFLVAVLALLGPLGAVDPVLSPSPLVLVIPDRFQSVLLYRRAPQSDQHPTSTSPFHSSSTTPSLHPASTVAPCTVLPPACSEPTDRWTTLFFNESLFESPATCWARLLGRSLGAEFLRNEDSFPDPKCPSGCDAYSSFDVCNLESEPANSGYLATDLVPLNSVDWHSASPIDDLLFGLSSSQLGLNFSTNNVHILTYDWRIAPAWNSGWVDAFRSACHTLARYSGVRITILAVGLGVDMTQFALNKIGVDDPWIERTIESVALIGPLPTGRIQSLQSLWHSESRLPVSDPYLLRTVELSWSSTYWLLPQTIGTMNPLLTVVDNVNHVDLPNSTLSVNTISEIMIRANLSQLNSLVFEELHNVRSSSIRWPSSLATLCIDHGPSRAWTFSVSTLSWSSAVVRNLNDSGIDQPRNPCAIFFALASENTSALLRPANWTSFSLVRSVNDTSPEGPDDHPSPLSDPAAQRVLVDILFRNPPLLYTEDIAPPKKKKYDSHTMILIGSCSWVGAMICGALWWHQRRRARKYGHRTLFMAWLNRRALRAAAENGNGDGNGNDNGHRSDQGDTSSAPLFTGGGSGQHSSSMAGSTAADRDGLIATSCMPVAGIPVDTRFSFPFSSSVGSSAGPSGRASELTPLPGGSLLAGRSGNRNRTVVAVADGIPLPPLVSVSLEDDASMAAGLMPSGSAATSTPTASASALYVRNLISSTRELSRRTSEKVRQLAQRTLENVERARAKLVYYAERGVLVPISNASARGAGMVVNAVYVTKRGLEAISQGTADVIFGITNSSRFPRGNRVDDERSRLNQTGSNALSSANAGPYSAEHSTTCQGGSYHEGGTVIGTDAMTDGGGMDAIESGVEDSVRHDCSSICSDSDVGDCGSVANGGGHRYSTSFPATAGTPSIHPQSTHVTLTLQSLQAFRNQSQFTRLDGSSRGAGSGGRGGGSVSARSEGGTNNSILASPRSLCSDTSAEKVCIIVDPEEQFDSIDEIDTGSMVRHSYRRGSCDSLTSLASHASGRDRLRHPLPYSVPPVPLASGPSSPITAAEPTILPAAGLSTQMSSQMSAEQPDPASPSNHPLSDNASVVLNDDEGRLQSTSTDTIPQYPSDSILGRMSETAVRTSFLDTSSSNLDTFNHDSNISTQSPVDCEMDATASASVCESSATFTFRSPEAEVVAYDFRNPSDTESNIFYDDNTNAETFGLLSRDCNE